MRFTTPVTAYSRAALLACASILLTACSNEAALKRHLATGDQLLEAGKPADAIVEYRAAVDGDEAWGEARFKLAEAYAANAQPERAFREYVRAADLLPEDAAAQLKAATYLLITGQYQDAKTRVERLLQKQPDNVEALIVLGNAMAGLRDIDGAIAQVNEAIQLDPARSQSYTNLGLLTASRGEADQAKAAFQRAVETDPKSTSARLAMANFLWSQNDFAGAEQSLMSAHEVDPAHVLTNRALATFYVATGRAPEAERYLQAAVEANGSAASLLELADYYILTRRSDDAIKVLEPLTAKAAAAGAAEVRLAALAYTAGQTVDAHARLDRFLKRSPNDALALLLKARWLMTEGNYERALVRATAAIAADPRMVAAHYIKGQLQAATRRGAEAINSFNTVLRLNPRASIAQVQISRLYLSRNELDSAVLYAEEALRNAPASVEAKLALTRAWIARGDDERARVAIDQLRKGSPDVAGVHALDGSFRLLSGDLPRALAAYERALQLDPMNLEALDGATKIDVRQGQIKRARARIELRLDVAKDKPELMLLAAKVLIVDHDRSGAERLLRRAIEVDPFATDTFVLLGQIYADGQRLDEVGRELDQVVARDPKNLGARVMAAMIAHARGDLADARTRYEAILKDEPRVTVAANNLAAIYAEAGENLEVAERLAENATAQIPSNPELHDTLGMVHFRRQQYADALRSLQQSVALDPENATYRFHVGLVYQKQGDRERAKEALQAALKLDPQFSDARQSLAELASN